MGYKRAGYRVIGNCEIDSKIAEVYRRNLHPEISYVMDIREFNTIDDLPDCLYELDVLDGSPPCSTFSTAGSRAKAWGVEKQFAEGQIRQRLDDLFFVYLETVARLRPKVFVAENVTGLIEGKARGYVNEIISKAKSIGYDIQLFKLNAAFMGVPQLRERVFFVGNRMGYPKLQLRFEEEPILFGDVRSEHSGKMPGKVTMDRLSRKVRSDRHIGNITMRDIGKMTSFVTAIMWDDEVCRTVTTHKNIRACDDTFMTDDDLVAVSSFPQDYDFGDRKVPFVCAMSVPPSMMANIAHEIRGQWLNG